MDQQIKRPIISITGTSGKTTTKEMLASILQRRWRIFKSYENGNDVWFISEYAKQIDASYDAVVLEFGLTHLGSISEQCKMIQPNIGIITNVGMAHIEDIEKNIQGIEGIATAKSELIQGMSPSGLLVINSDDTNSKLLQIQGFQGKIITVSLSYPSDYKAYDILYSDSGMSFIVQLNGIEESFHIPIYGKHNVYNALFAIAVSHQLGFSSEEIRTGLKQFYKTQRRLEIHRFKNNIILINDTFNSKPCGMMSALDVVNQISKGTTIAILGYMNGLGSHTHSLHKEVGRHAASTNLDYIFTIGDESKYIGAGAIEAGFPPERVNHHLSVEALHQTLIKHLDPGTCILLKGFRQCENEENYGLFTTVSYLMNYLNENK